jgi:bifunctional non-homologous end joining protein LigD
VNYGTTLPMVAVSNAARVVFPDVGVTKGQVVAYYERIADKMLPHVTGRPLSIRRYPKGIAAPGFFQKNVPEHYPASFQRFAVPRSPNATKKHAAKRGKQQDVTLYPLVQQADQLSYLANQGAIELHVPTSRASDLYRPDRVVIDLDPPSGAVALVRRAAHLVRDALAEFGLPTVPLATGSKGYHLIAAIEPTLDADRLASAVQKFGALVVAAHPQELTLAYRVALRGSRVFIDWLRNMPVASVIAPFSLRATAHASVATPLTWAELDSVDPGGYALGDLDRLLDRPDPLAQYSAMPHDAAPFVLAVELAFEAAGLVLETFDRFRS